jgi:hypothetical protein
MINLDLPKDLALATQVAHLAIKTDVQAFRIAQLILRSRRAHSAGEREPSNGKSAHLERMAVEDYASDLGWKTDWPGLWPTFTTKDGHEIYLPG